METIFRDGLFEGKTALVTGGGAGIGLRAARELAKLGARVAISGRNEEKLEAGLSALRSEGAVATTIRCNIREEGEVADMVKAAVDWGGGLDLLVNNAGGQFPSAAESIKTKGWKAVIDTNLTGTFLVTREAFNQAMRESGGAVVTVVANTRKGFPFMAHTGAARAGVENLTKTLAVEWGKYGVRVNAVAPGVIDSSGLDSYGPEFKPYIEEARAFNQAWRLGTEAEVSAALVFLLSPGAAYITGETLQVDAGEWLYAPGLPPVENDRNPPFGKEGR